MARHSIVEKLDVHLSHQLRTEVEVVYLLVELRKLLEHDHKKNIYAVVNFYANWVAHTKLEASPIADQIVKWMDTLHRPRNEEPLNNLLAAELQGLLGCERFKNELKCCLQYYQLPDKICTDQKHWLRFLKQLGRIIEDCPLRIQAKKKKVAGTNETTATTSFVESVSVSVSPKKPQKNTLSLTSDGLASFIKLSPDEVNDRMNTMMEDQYRARLASEEDAPFQLAWTPAFHTEPEIRITISFTFYAS